ncbi:hypothetical protein ACFYR1_49925 [Streptomyces canus]|uniref:hypothetical protein n=1 Tax=Streptomyces canus TaxID=58343 RepID=UPI0036AAC4B1
MRFVVTSRPHTALDGIRKARSQSVADIAIDPRSTQVREDLLTFTERELASGTADEVLRANGRDTVEFARWLVRRASGNFSATAAEHYGMRDERVATLWAPT